MYYNHDIKKKGSYGVLLLKTSYKGDIIIISAGTGKGKSFLIKNPLFSYAKEEEMKILMLIHRTDCVKQFSAEIERDCKQTCIDVMTYQKIERNLIMGRSIDMQEYKYICCDEFHYWTEDASFNKTTDLSFKYVMQQVNAVRIFMSATGEDITKYITDIENVNPIKYEIPLDFSFIKTLNFYTDDSNLEQIAESIIKKKEKAIFFIQSASKAYKFYEKYKENALFNCSTNNKIHKYVDNDKIQKMLNDEKFNETFLVTTSCMDAGVNIIDEKVKTIIADIKDVSSLIQCIGRKRLNNDEKIDIYIKLISNQALAGMQTITKQKIEKAKFFSKYGLDEYLKKYPRDNDVSNIIYDQKIEESDNINACEKKINMLMYNKNKMDIEKYRQMISLHKNGYAKYLAGLFGFYDKESQTYNFYIMPGDTTLEEYLRAEEGNVLLERSDRDKLVEKINLRGNGKLRHGINALNEELKTRKLNFKIRKFETSRMVDGKKKKYKNAWIIERIDK